jgi:hypothetical protein
VAAFWVGIPGELTDDQRSALERAELHVEEDPPPQTTAGFSEVYSKAYRVWVRVPEAEDEAHATGWVAAAIGVEADQLVVRSDETMP